VRRVSAVWPPSVRAAAEVADSGRCRPGEHPGARVMMAGTPAGRERAADVRRASDSWRSRQTTQHAGRTKLPAPGRARGTGGAGPEQLARTALTPVCWAT
jgi:hypothetical protein